VFTLVFFVSGCLSEGSSSSNVTSARIGRTLPGSVDDPTLVGNPSASNNAPRIQGRPPANVVAGQQYLFVPKATDADGDALSFSVQNLPDWASFDSATGRLWGNPALADVGAYESIVVTVSDGSAQARLPEFSVAVVQTGQASLTLTWQPPTENTDGTPLVNLSGYKIHYGNASGNYTTTISVASPGITRYVVEGLGSGTYFFAVTAYTAGGTESDYSDEASTTIS
jgi:hypothetical protein